jgi:O-antigen ligase
VQTVLLAAGITSFLSNAATIHVTYTLKVSYILAATAAVIGLPWMVSGWRSAGGWLRTFAFLLILIYGTSILVGHPGVIAGSTHTGFTRELVYMVDLCVGLGTVGVIAGVWPGTRVKIMAVALVLAGILGAAYAIYQWLGLHFRWPLTNINNTLDSNGITTDVNQGVGVFGWERARGTFLEPHFLGAYLAAVWPMCVGIALSASRRRTRSIAWGGAALLLIALLTTDSAPAWASLAIVCFGAAGTLAVARGRPVLATFTVATVVGACAMLPVIGIERGTAVATGRSVGVVAFSTKFRTAIWSRVLDLWAHRPILGTGPGQAPIRLANADALSALPVSVSGHVLVSSQGVLAAALLDAGLLGFVAWLLLLGALIYAALRDTMSRGTYLAAAILAAAVIAVFASFTSGDRLELWVWMLLGIALAASRAEARQAAGCSGH